MKEKSKAELGPCRGGANCPLDIKEHPQNGEEFSLGCGLCRNLKDQYKDEGY